jgi:phospho-N-acetylmuramoyl-pentapeptide-transferase
MYLTGLEALLTAIIISAIAGPIIIKGLHKWHFNQSVRDCGPAEHQKKNGTPTMGGLIIILAIVVSTFLWCTITPRLGVALWLLVGYGIIGFLDDSIKIIFHRNLGLTSKQKLILQILVAVVYLIHPGDVSASTSQLWIPGLNTSVDLGIWYYLFAILLLVGTTNAVNLTDGLDGLASWVTVPVTLAFAFIGYHNDQELVGIFALTITGAALGFLIFNHYPAKVFMGDTGSLALGGGVAALALLTHTELLLIIIGGVYVAEALSVIIQVAYFKHTGGKRIFRMAPLHHHFELGGLKETAVVLRFTMASAICGLLGMLLFALK